MDFDELSVEDDVYDIWDPLHTEECDWLQCSPNVEHVEYILRLGRTGLRSTATSLAGNLPGCACKIC